MRSYTGMNESTELFMAQRDHGIDAHGTAGWNVTGCHRNAEPKRGNLEIPVIGLAKSGWSLRQLHKRAKSSVENHGGLAGTNDKFNVQLKDLSLLFLLIQQVSRSFAC